MSDPNYRGTVEERERHDVAPERNVGVYDKGTSQSRTTMIIGIVAAVLVILLLLWWLL